jgi:hypothetical protein
MCQYIINLFNRLPPSDAFDQIRSGQLNFDIAIPKFHLPAHVPDCHADYSLNNLPGVGRVDGEANERNWATSNKAAGSTIDMGPGARKDTLNGFFGALNWRKRIRLGMYLTSITGDTSLKELVGKSLLVKMHEAVLERDLQQKLFRAMDHGWQLGGKHTETWLAEVQEWESRQRKWEAGDQNPYRPRVKRTFPIPLHLLHLTPYSALTKAQVQLKLAEKDSEILKLKPASIAKDTHTPSEFISMGIDIELAQ